MGLDVYLSRIYAPLEEVDAAQQKLEEALDEVWGRYSSYDDMTDQQKEDARVECDRLQREYEAAEGGKYRVDAIDIPSAKYPEHLFRIGYMRSSYNNAGINSVMMRNGLNTLYEIFEYQRKGYRERVNWSRARERAVLTLAAYNATVDTTAGKVDCFQVTERPKIEGRERPESEADAIRAYAEVADKNSGGMFREFSQFYGDFFLDGLDVVAIISGTGYAGAPCLYVVYKKPIETRQEDTVTCKHCGVEQTTEDRVAFYCKQCNAPLVSKTVPVPDWYAQSLEIVIEMCDWVLAQPDPDRYVLSWSG